jgi:hypothetical protein
MATSVVTPENRILGGTAQMLYGAGIFLAAVAMRMAFRYMMYRSKLSKNMEAKTYAKRAEKAAAKASRPGLSDDEQERADRAATKARHRAETAEWRAGL